jgi:hypothetical protein
MVLAVRPSAAATVPEALMTAVDTTVTIHFSFLYSWQSPKDDCSGTPVAGPAEAREPPGPIHYRPR